MKAGDLVMLQSLDGISGHADLLDCTKPLLFRAWKPGFPRHPRWAELIDTDGCTQVIHRKYIKKVWTT